MHKKKDENFYTKVSKKMCFLLRHKATDYGLTMESSGFVKLDDLLKSEPLKGMKLTIDQIIKIVEDDKKGRYELVNRPPYYIRAVQGHSLKTVKDEDILTPIDNVFEYPTVVHGTYYKAWEFIKNTGLNRMNRNSIRKIIFIRFFNWFCL